MWMLVSTEMKVDYIDMGREGECVIQDDTQAISLKGGRDRGTVNGYRETARWWC